MSPPAPTWPRSRRRTPRPASPTAATTLRAVAPRVQGLVETCHEGCDGTTSQQQQIFISRRSIACVWISSSLFQKFPFSFYFLEVKRLGLVPVQFQSLEKPRSRSVVSPGSVNFPSNIKTNVSVLPANKIQSPETLIRFPLQRWNIKDSWGFHQFHIRLLKVRVSVFSCPFC